MGRSSLLGVDEAPLESIGRDEEALGPSDSSDSGSDRVGADDLPSADPAEPTDVTVGRDIAHAPIEQADSDNKPDSASDISVDRIFDTDQEAIDGLDDAATIDQGMAPDPLSDEDEEDEEEADAEDVAADEALGTATQAKPRRKRGPAAEG